MASLNTRFAAQLPDDPVELAALMDAAAAKFAAAAFTASTEDELVSTAETMESVRRRLDGADAALMVEVDGRSAYRRTGTFTIGSFLANHLRLGPAEAKRRRLAILALGRFSALTGETLEPRLPATADAVADGEIGGDHVRVIADAIDHIPSAVDPELKARAEAHLAAVAPELTPEGLRLAGKRLVDHLDPDGDLIDEKDRQRSRGFTVGCQDRALMSKVNACLTPELRATFEVVLQQWAAKGMNNPEDPESPKGAADVADPDVLAAAAERDQRFPAQRNHDALLAILQAVHAASGLSPTKLSTELVITVTSSELARQAGVALTATGTRLPVQDLVHVAAQAQPHLAVFDEATGRALWFGRGKRFATKDQRLVLFARDRGCTAPGCDVPFSRTEAHHAVNDWQYGGTTDIDDLGAACGKHNRSVDIVIGSWERCTERAQRVEVTTVLRDGPNSGRVAWRPVGRRGRKSWRVNQIHHAELLPDQGPHAPPDPARSRVEAHLANLLAA